MTLSNKLNGALLLQNYLFKCLLLIKFFSWRHIWSLKSCCILVNWLAIEMINPYWMVQWKTHLKKWDSKFFLWLLVEQTSIPIQKSFVNLKVLKTTFWVIQLHMDFEIFFCLKIKIISYLPPRKLQFSNFRKNDREVAFKEYCRKYFPQDICNIQTFFHLYN